MLPPGDSSQPPPAALLQEQQQPERTADLLGHLPTRPLNNILARLSARDVVRTSVLSPPWRRRWETVPGLDIELHDVRDEGDNWASAARFLERCAGPVGRVSIRGVPVSVCHRADHWLRLVSGKKPRALSLALPQATMLRSLFLCDPDALAELDLRSCAIPAPPAGFPGFQRLTKLDLDDVFFMGSSKQLEAMVAAATPTLLELRLQDIAFSFAAVDHGRFLPGGWVIQGPNIRRLVLRLRISGAGLWRLGPLPNLESARIFLTGSAEDRDFAQMFTAISNVRELHFGNFYVATQAAAIKIFQNLLWTFGNLRILRLDGSFHESPTNQLFSFSPFLETIEIKGWY